MSYGGGVLVLITNSYDKIDDSLLVSGGNDI